MTTASDVRQAALTDDEHGLSWEIACAALGRATGQAHALNRQGEDPIFEALAQAEGDPAERARLAAAHPGHALALHLASTDDGTTALMVSRPGAGSCGGPQPTMVMA